MADIRAEMIERGCPPSAWVFLAVVEPGPDHIPAANGVIPDPGPHGSELAVTQRQNACSRLVRHGSGQVGNRLGAERLAPIAGWQAHVPGRPAGSDEGGSVSLQPDDLFPDHGGLRPQVRVAGDGDADAGCGQFVGERLGVGRVCDDSSDVRQDAGTGDVPAKFIGQCLGQAGCEVRGSVRIEIGAVSGRRRCP